MCAEKYPALVCRAIGAQFIADDSIALFEFQIEDEGVRIGTENHCKLVSPDRVTDADLERCRTVGD